MQPPPLPAHASTLIVTTGNEIQGRPVTGYLGVVRGIIVRSMGIGQGFAGGLRAIGGGNIPEYAAVCEDARRDAYAEMLRHAAELGAHAVIGFRYDATEFVQGATEVLAYGTAVTLGQD